MNIITLFYGSCMSCRCQLDWFRGCLETQEAVAALAEIAVVPEEPWSPLHISLPNTLIHHLHQLEGHQLSELYSVQ